MDKNRYKTRLMISAIMVLTLCGVTLTSCKDDDPVDNSYFSIDGIDTDAGDCIYITVGQPGKGAHKNLDGLQVTESYQYTIRTEAHWQIIPKSEDTSWIRFLSTEGDGSSKIIFGIWPNETFDPRTADFALVLDGVEQPHTFIHVEQAKKIPTFSIVGGNLVSIPDEGGAVSIEVESNTGDVDFTIEYPEDADSEWLKYNKKSSSATTLVFEATPNMGENEREVYVTVFSKAIPELSQKVTVVQNTFALLLFDDFSYLNYTTDTNIWNGTGAKAIEQWTGDAANSGWIGLLNGVQTASYVYGRKGYALLGNNGRIGTIASPAFTKIEEGGTADVAVTFDCVHYVAESGTHDYNDLYVGIWGSGEIEGADSDLTVNYKQLGGKKTLRVLHINVVNSPNLPVGIFPEGYNEWDSNNARISLRVNNATNETRVVLMGGYWEDQRKNNVFDSPDPVQNGVKFRRNNKNNRLGIDNFKATRILK